MMSSLKVSRRIPAPPEDVYAAWLDESSLRQWMHVAPAPCSVVEVDARVGGRYRLVMLGPDGNDAEITGEYVELDPPRRITFTWAFTATGDPDSLVTVTFAPAADNETDLVLIHERLTSDAAVTGHRAGWEAIAANLAAHMGQPGPATIRQNW